MQPLPILSVVAAIVIILLMHEVARGLIPLLVRFSYQVPLRLGETRIWLHSEAIRSRLAKRNPPLFGFVRGRFEPRRFAGLPLTLMITLALYVAALFSGLTNEVLEAQGVVRFDNIVNAAFESWRVEPLISAFLWITALGSSPAIVSAVIIATGFLCSQRRYHLIAPMWITCAGAETTTSIGKFLIGRHRPESVLDITAAFPSFPSGHTTAASAVYGFLAYIIARDLQNARGRFEVVYWTAVLIGLIGLSRIVLGLHYATDVAGGFLMGGFWLLIGFIIAEWSRPAASEFQSGPGT